MPEKIVPEKKASNKIEFNIGGTNLGLSRGPRHNELMERINKHLTLHQDKKTPSYEKRDHWTVAVETMNDLFTHTLEHNALIKAAPKDGTHVDIHDLNRLERVMAKMRKRQNDEPEEILKELLKDFMKERGIK